MAGEFSYFVTSHLDSQRKLIQININDMKTFQLPSTIGWSLNQKYFGDAVAELGIKVRNSNVLIDFEGIHSLVQDILDGKLSNLQFFVVPDWPCMTWYKRLHDQVTAEAIKLPKQHDLFFDEKKRPLGMFAWEHWLFSVVVPTESMS